MKIFGKIAISLLLLFSALVGIASLAGFPPSYILAAPGVGTGIGAKLLCSARFVSGFSEQQAFDDLVQYSPILSNLTIEYDQDAKSVTTWLLGMSETTATHKPGLGCTVEYDGFNARDDGYEGFGDYSLTQPAPWPRGDEVPAPQQDMLALLRQQLSEDNTAGLNTRALLVVHRGDILAEVYDQETDAQTPLLGWSMAKSLMSTMIGNLEYRGLLTVADPPGFSEWADDGRAQITIEDMLHMSDGLSFSEEYNPGDDATAMLFTVPSASDYVIEKSLARLPGEYFNYSSGTANVLSRVYFEKTGGIFEDSYRDFLENIYRPMGFTNAVFEVDASGVLMGSSYLYASARDWARLGQLMLNGGVINGTRIVENDWLTRATTPNNTENNKAYGYQWWLNRGNEQLRWPDFPEDAYSAQGNRQQWMVVIPSREAIIVRLGWTAGSYPMNERFARILDQLD